MAKKQTLAEACAESPWFTGIEDCKRCDTVFIEAILMPTKESKVPGAGIGYNSERFEMCSQSGVWATVSWWDNRNKAVALFDIPGCPRAIPYEWENRIKGDGTVTMTFDQYVSEFARLAVDAAERYVKLAPEIAARQ